MINQIVEAVSLALNSEFGDGYKIYTEEVEQGNGKSLLFCYQQCSEKAYFQGKKILPD